MADTIYNRIHEALLSEVLHMDETRIQCNKEEGKKLAVILSCGLCEAQPVKISRQLSSTIPELEVVRWQNNY